MKEPDSRTNALSRLVIGAALRVHRQLGPGHMESVYEAAPAVELRRRRIPFERQVRRTVVYEGTSVGTGRFDFLVDGRLIVEIKAVKSLAPIHKAQVRSYLKTSGVTLGLLMNFNVCKLVEGIRRVVHTRSE